jgi:lon-related putative ATP-dependent protease
MTDERTAMSQRTALPPEELRLACLPESLGFATTEELEPFGGVVGQDRAIAAINFSLGLNDEAYNVYIAGPPGTGKTETALSLMRELARSMPTPDDWCYVHNFEEPDNPIAINLPAGRGSELVDDMKELVSDCRREVPRAFESDLASRRSQEAMAAVQEARSELMSRVEEQVGALGFAIQQGPNGIATIPIIGGEPASQETYEALSDDEKADIRKRGEQVQAIVNQSLLELRKLEKQATTQSMDLAREIAMFAVDPMFAELRRKYSDVEHVLPFLDAVEKDMLDNLERFRPADPAQGIPAALVEASREGEFAIYEVNLLVNNKGLEGAPVVLEHSPTYHNLMGRIDYVPRMGAMLTDFHQVKAGSLQRANGGFLLAYMKEVLSNPLAWNGLKHALMDGEVRIENMSEQLSIVPTATIRPQPIPLDLKLALIGDRQLYFLLHSFDEDFRRLFAVRADFDAVVDRTDDSTRQYARFVQNQIARNDLLPFSAAAVAEVIEEGARMAAHKEKLSTDLAGLSHLIKEATYWARRQGAERVEAEHVSHALEQQVYRSNLVEDRIQELIEDGTLLIDTEGSVAGQVNGLSVYDLGDYSFGRPSRITARTSVGQAGVTNIERENALGGRIHNKGFMILNSFLAGRYAQTVPLSISASITFEQLYDEVEGDSASSAELYALLSSISGLPIDQGIAVTGSVNQRGEIQAIGGVNQKVEGFFAVCKARRLTGRQGVLIPAANVRNLMLRDEVVRACAAGQFHVWAVSHVDQGLEILIGMPAGERGSDGNYPEGTINRRIEDSLREFQLRLVAHARSVAIQPERDGKQPAEAAEPQPAAVERPRGRRRETGSAK